MGRVLAVDLVNVVDLGLLVDIAVVVDAVALDVIVSIGRVFALSIEYFS